MKRVRKSKKTEPKPETQGTPKPPVTSESSREASLANLAPHRWQPGQSGNPSGRPRKFMTLLSDALREKLKEVDPASHKTFAEILADKLIDEGINGRLPVQAISEIADRAEGKPQQTVNVNDHSKEFDGRSVAELEHYAQHGTWPNDVGPGE